MIRTVDERRNSGEFRYNLSGSSVLLFRRKVAVERKLDIILDKAANSGILYSNPAFDRTDDVIIKLGLNK